MTDAATQRGLASHSPPAERGELTASSHRDGDTQTLALHGELDLASAARVRAELEHIEASGAPRIVIDLSGLTFLDSSGVQLVLGAHARTLERGLDLQVRRGPAAVQRVFELCGVDKVLPFID